MDGHTLCSFFYSGVYFMLIFIHSLYTKDIKPSSFHSKILTLVCFCHIARVIKSPQHKPMENTPWILTLNMDSLQVV